MKIIPILLILLILVTVSMIPKTNGDAGLGKEIERLKTEIEKLEKILEDYQSPQWVTVTAFTACMEECGVDPNTTAAMEPLRPGTVAVSRDLFYEYGWTFGKKLYIEGVGVYRIGCLMRKDKRMMLDIFIDHKGKAKQFGKLRTRACLIGG